MSGERSRAARRFLAFMLDWLVIAFWGGLLFAGVMVANGGDPQGPEGPWRAQGLGLLAMTIPVVLGFAVCEWSGLRATPGKRVLGLAVSDESGEKLSFGSALFRNLLKFLPWECGHTVAQQAIFAGEAGLSTWVWAPMVGAFLGPVWWIAAILMTGRAPYDRWAGSRVVNRSKE